MSVSSSDGGSSRPTMIWFRRLVNAALIYATLVAIISLGSLLALLHQPYGGFLWAWDNTHGVYRTDIYTPEASDTLQAADYILAIEGQSGPPNSLHVMAQELYRTAGTAVCQNEPTEEGPALRYRVLRRGEELTVDAPIRCFRWSTLLRVSALPMVLGVLLLVIGVSVYRVNSQQELNLTFALCAAWTSAAITIQAANLSDIYAPWGQFAALTIRNPSPTLAIATFGHLFAIMPRQHLSRWLNRTPWFWYLLMPLSLIALGTFRYLDDVRWSPAVGQLESITWWVLGSYAVGIAVSAIARSGRIYFTSSSRQAKHQARLMLLSMLVFLLAVPFQIAQQEPQLLTQIPLNQSTGIFWLVPIFVIIAYAILRYQVFPGRIRGLNVLIGLIVTVFVAMLVYPIQQLDPELGFVALLVVLAGVGMFWAMPNPVMEVLRRFSLPGTIERTEIERFNADIQSNYDLESLPAVIVESLEKHLQLRYAALWLEHEPGTLVLEAFTDKAPAADLPDHLLLEAVWQERPTRVAGGPLAAAQCEILLPLTAGGRPVGLIGIGKRWTEEVLDDTDLLALGVMADQAALTLSTARQIRALQLVPLQLEKAQLDERDRIAQDLHDSTQAQLTQLAFALERVRGQLYSDPTKSEELLDGCVRDVNQASRDLRAILRDLIPKRLLGQTLHRLLRTYVENAQRVHPSVAISLQVDNGVESTLSEETKLVLLRICQQALDNALAHAQAQAIQLTVQLSADRGRLEFAVRDDGRGFIQRPVSQLVEQGHHGLYIISSRALQQGGQVTVDSTPGVGTVIKGYLPAG